MDGHYPRRAEDKDASVSDSFRESAAHYANNVKSSKDPLMKLVSDLAGSAGGIGDRVRRGFDGFTSGPQNGTSKGGPEGGPKDAPGPEGDEN
jgi:hypothetical protein